MWRVLGTFASALQCVLCTLLANVPSFPHSLVSIHSAPWFSQCYFHRWLGGRLWLGSHGDLLAAKEIAALLTAPTLQHFNCVRIFKGIWHLLIPFSPTKENQQCEKNFINLMLKLLKICFVSGRFVLLFGIHC